jgi:hypothetical protein
MSPIGRFGQFFFFIGLLALIVFFASLQSDSPQFHFCLSGGVLFFLGVYAMWKGRNPEVPPDERFYTLRRLRSRKSKRK